MAEKKSRTASRLKKTVTKLTAFIRLCFLLRRSPRRLRSSDSDDRDVGIRIFFEDQRRIAENSSVRKTERASSSSYRRRENDVDLRSEFFIETIHSTWRLERQISLQLKYYRVNSCSSETEYDDRSPPPPPISPSI